MAKKRKPKPRKKAKYESPESAKGYKRIGAIVGPHVLAAVARDFGREQVDAAALTLGKQITEKEARKIKQLRGRKKQLPLSELDKLRHKEITKIGQRLPPFRFHRRDDGYYDRVDTKTKKKKRVTRRQKLTYETRFPREKFISQITKLLPVTRAKARKILSSVEKDRIRRFEKFKKTARYKRLSAKKKRRYTKRGLRQWAIRRLMILLLGSIKEVLSP